MILLTLLLAAQTESQFAIPDDLGFVSSIVVRTDKLDDRDLKAAKRYAHCVSFPNFKMGAELTARLTKCRKAHDIKRPSAALAETLDHLDHIVAQNPGSEATLTVTRPNAPNS